MKKAKTHSALRIISLAVAFVVLAVYISGSNTAFAWNIDTPASENRKAVFWYDSQGLPLEEDKIMNLNPVQNPERRGTFCCSPSTMHKITVYEEQHTISGEVPAWCVYDRYKLVVCDYCTAVWSRTYVGQFQHIHT